MTESETATAKSCVDCVFYEAKSSRCKNLRMGNQIVGEGCYCAFFDPTLWVCRTLKSCPFCKSPFVNIEPVPLENGSARASIVCEDCGIRLTRDVIGEPYQVQVNILVDKWNDLERK